MLNTSPAPLYNFMFFFLCSYWCKYCAWKRPKQTWDGQ